MPRTRVSFLQSPPGGAKTVKITLHPNEVPGLQQDILRTAGASISDSAKRIERTAIKLAPRDRGKLRRSIRGRPAQFKGSSVRSRITIGEKYGKWQEEGTNPFWPPTAPIREWVRRKGLHRKLPGFAARADGTRRRISLSRRLEAMTHMVRRSIAEHGIRPKRFMARAWNRERGRAKLETLNSIVSMLRRKGRVST